MKKLSLLLIVLLVLSSINIFASPAISEEYEMPNGAHYNLNIIGVPKDKTMKVKETSGHVIFVPLFGKARINLIEGDDYRVLDKNGTDADGAAFQLPNPDPGNVGVTEYSVYARALGKPFGKAVISPGGIDADGKEWYSAGTLTLERKKGPSKFRNVSKELLYIYVDLDGDGSDERYNLFNDALEEYFWDYNNEGLKLAQLRFYDVSTGGIPEVWPK